jgi:peptidoglycan biosynthesis protein MviN/MurJ (putative lipid II flippase)
VAVSIAGVALNIALSILLARVFEARGWLPFGGIALANSIATWAEAIALFVMLAARVGLGGHVQPLMHSSLTACVAALAMALLVWLVSGMLGAGVMATLLTMVAAVAGYALAALVLGNPEVRQLAHVVLQRLRRM